MQVITLTTDFGLRDPYVAAMKGAILALLAPAGRLVHLVDVSHDVPPHDIVEAALALEAAVPCFPRGTIHVAVVDPGVGSARRGLVLAARGQVFIGPDNGLFTPMLGEGGWAAFELAAAAYRRPVVSRTFHGRDVFAPAAAHVALGVELERFGPPVTDPVRLDWLARRPGSRAVTGQVVHVDRFGNLITSIRGDWLAAEAGLPAGVRIRGRVLRVVGTYAELPPGRAGALLGSSDRLEIALREGSAARALGARRGTPVEVSRPAPTTRGRRSR